MNMMRIISILVFLTFNWHNCRSQDNLWLLGYRSFSSSNQLGGSDINFWNNQILISQHQRAMDFGITNANIADRNGNLLFYTNGRYIANNIDQLMLNGDSLNPGQFAQTYLMGLPLIQATLILPFPGNPEIYYLFHETLEFGLTSGPSLPLYLYYSVIDMRLDSGRGGVTLKNQIALSDSLFIGGLTAVRHANGRDWWIVIRKYDSNEFCTLLFDNNGISLIGTASINTLPHSYSMSGNMGQCVFSPDGKYYASYSVGYGLSILNFDRCYGTLSNCTYIPILDTVAAGGVAFSANSRYLYASATTHIYQFDMHSSPIANSIDTVAFYDNFYDSFPLQYTTFFLMQLAVNNKIYINSPLGVRYLSVIENPDIGGNVCDVRQHSIQLPTYNSYTIPNHVNYSLLADSSCILSLFTDSIASNYNIFSISRESNRFTVHSKLKISNISIYDINGRLILTRADNSNYIDFDLSNLKSAIYFCHLNIQNQIYNIKLNIF